MTGEVKYRIVHAESGEQIEATVYDRYLQCEAAWLNLTDDVYELTEPQRGVMVDGEFQPFVQESP